MCRGSWLVLWFKKQEFLVLVFFLHGIQSEERLFLGANLESLLQLFQDRSDVDND